MAHRAKRTIIVALTCLLILALLRPGYSPAFSPELPVMAQVVAPHGEETAGHGHRHAESDGLSQTFDGHTHDAADHDHNPAFIFARKAPGRVPPCRARLLMADTRQWQAPASDLDRPPRG
tara:strand:- start:570 stop:929 length:360 start_codon:yes stop_codon:yes gene_type:complete